MSLRNNQKRLPMVFVCENIRSAYNVGSIFRCADALRATKIFLVGITPTPQNTKVRKTALGAEKTVPWKHLWDIAACLKSLKKEKFQIIGLETHVAAKNYAVCRPRFPIALVLGNEVDGLSKEAGENVDFFCSIPMRGKKESLNVSHAAAIVSFDFSKRWYAKKN